MKNILLSTSIFLAMLTGCATDESQDCNCGLILSDDSSDYSILIRNNCSGNNKRFILYAGDWMTAYVGDDYCMSSGTSW
jgi:hypothetical protein